MKKRSVSLSRRQFLRTVGATGVGAAAGPYLSLGASAIDNPVTRVLGRTGAEVTTLGLGGQASLQWTPKDVVPTEIIVKAVNLGLTYFDTSNVYGRSQLNYGAAFRALGLAPGEANFDERKRRNIFLASKTMIRYARGSKPGMRARTNGPRDSTAVDDLRRSLSQIFGDGKGDYPDGAYVDLMQIHNLNNMEEVDAIYEGLDNADAERIGALPALVDYRDGTNRTGLNPKEEKLIRHIGISGHSSSPVLMECIQRDDRGIIDTLLVAINANDRLYLNHQHNVIPVVTAKGLGIIGMKVFADGAMYTKRADWTRLPREVVRTVGDPSLPSEPLIQYSLSIPGLTTNIIGIGHIDTERERCQLEQNFAASQITGSLDRGRMREIEQLAARAKNGETNYFQKAAEPLSPPRDAAVSQDKEGDERIVRLTWNTAYAGDEPVSHYAIERDGENVAKVAHRPQTTKTPFGFEERISDRQAHRYRLVAVDAAGRTASSDELPLSAVG
jgi:aryl-alcohol dehydrogenase-like predicted oxidoreductase